MAGATSFFCNVTELTPSAPFQCATASGTLIATVNPIGTAPYTATADAYDNAAATALEKGRI